MKIEEVISSAIMCVVSGLVLIGFTIAWFTDLSAGATVTGFEAEALKLDNIRVALEKGGDDISKLKSPYAGIEFAKYLDVDLEGNEELAPGTCGQVTFYVTPTNINVQSCDIVPVVRITQDESTWYPTKAELENAGEESSEESGDSSESGDESSNDVSTEDTLTIEKLYEIVQGHIEFYSDPNMTNKITADNPLKLTWEAGDWDSNQNSKSEKTAIIYWKWHYVYPFTTDQLSGDNKLSDAKKKELIYAYDKEDMEIGNNISGMKFYFTFTAR